MSKYKNKKAEVDGIVFDSRREAARYKQLKLLERAQEITGLQLQVRYTLIPGFKTKNGTTIRKVSYVADFVYYDQRSGRTVIEDVKGYRTPVYNLKKKLFAYVYFEQGLEITEI